MPSMPSQNLNGEWFNDIPIDNQMHNNISYTRYAMHLCSYQPTIHINASIMHLEMKTSVWILIYSGAKTKWRMFWKHFNRQLDV